MRNSELRIPTSPIKETCVYLVGAGPGDPGLLTLKALRVIKRADVVVYDRLVSEEVMELVPTGVSRIYVGKEVGGHSNSQSEINESIVRLAKSGHKVVRLKGGDPFLFGRGGEEAEYLSAQGVRFEVVPGITAAIGCAAYSGIPLTHRDWSQSVVFITGHGQAGGEMQEHIVAHYLANRNSTLVIYMGLRRARAIFDSLIENGMPEQAPVALIESGTTGSQRRIIATAKNAHSEAIAADLSSPTMIVIGEVVRMANELDWFVPDRAFVDNEKFVNENG